MELEHSVHHNILVLTPKVGSLDAKCSPDFKESVLTILKNQKNKQVLLNLGHVNFIDSSGLGCLISLLRHLHMEKGELKLVHINKPIRTMFDLVSMNKIFELFDTLDEAVKSFQDKPKAKE